MGKPYDHQYFFAGSGSRNGTMICAHCNQPVFNHNQDWMSYKKSCKDDAGWNDWKFVCFHRECREDQSGWEDIERDKNLALEKHKKLIDDLANVAKKHNQTCPVSFACLAAEALGEDDLEDYYFQTYGSC